ncbi:MAG: PEGA domain-containing protein [Spirochaetia bacterium]
MAFGSLLRLLSAVTLFPVFLLAGCASFPSPSSDKDSLFVVISENPAPRTGPEKGSDTLRFNGPTPFRIRVGSEERRGYFVRVKPGRYTLAGSDLAAGPTAAAASGFDVPEGAVCLFPMKFTRERGDGQVRLRRLVPLDPEDQKNAAALLADYVDFERWLGRAVVGFGAYPPRIGHDQGNVELDISSTPSGAQVTIDERGWGATPLKATVQTGQHLLQVEIPGIASAKSLIDVQSREEMHVTLHPLPEREAKDFNDGSRKISILLSGFQNLGSTDYDNYRSVFPQVIGADLRDDTRIDLVDAGQGAPDFALARQKGIDLVVSGYYTARNDGLLVHAALYDVETGLPRASITYTGKAGLAMFDSIDSMAAEFIKGIGRALPAVRQGTVKNGGTFESRTVSYENVRAETAIVEKREAMRSSLSFFVGPSVSAIGSVYQPEFPYALLAFVPFGAIYDYSLGGPISLTAILQPAVAFGPGTAPGTSYTSVPYLDIPLRVGPAYTLFGPNADFSFGFLGGARFTRAWFDNGSGGKDYKSVWVFGLDLETSARLYTQPRISDRPSYFLFGFEWYLVGVETEFDLSQPRGAPLEIALSLGYGFRL